MPMQPCDRVTILLFENLERYGHSESMPKSDSPTRPEQDSYMQRCHFITMTKIKYQRYKSK